MEIHVSQQAGVFLWMALAGCCSSFVYDAFRIYRRLFSMPDWAVLLCDGIFWVLTSVISFAMVLYSNSGELRWFVFAGFVIGGVVYFVLLSDITSAVLLFVLKIIVRLCMLMQKIANTVRKAVAAVLKPPAKKLGSLKKIFKIALYKQKRRFLLLLKVNKGKNRGNFKK